MITSGTCVLRTPGDQLKMSILSRPKIRQKCKTMYVLSIIKRINIFQANYIKYLFDAAL